MSDIYGIKIKRGEGTCHHFIFNLLTLKRQIILLLPFGSLCATIMVIGGASPFAADHRRPDRFRRRTADAKIRTWIGFIFTLHYPPRKACGVFLGFNPAAVEFFQRIVNRKFVSYLIAA